MSEIELIFEIGLGFGDGIFLGNSIKPLPKGGKEEWCLHTGQVQFMPNGNLTSN
jgi:hypothetical protein